MSNRLRSASDQDLLIERRENALERHRESCDTAREMLAHHIADIDAELARRRT